MNETKLYEFRRVIPRNENARRAIVYSTSPIQKIVCSFRMGEVIKEEPSRLWSELGRVSGISESEFFDYFRGCAIGYAIGVSDVRHFDPPVDPWDVNPQFVPPQSFRYVDWHLSECGEDMASARLFDTHS